MEFKQMIAYICEQGAKIRREGERLIVRGQGEPQTLFSNRLEQLLLFGNVHLTAQARSLLIAKKIDTVFLSAFGSYRGRLVCTESKNVFLRKRQYSLLDDGAFQLAVAREIARAKLHNQAAMLGRLKREHNIAEAALGVNELKALAHEAEEAKSLDSLRGVEGSAAAVYFHYFAFAFHQDWGFSRRTRRPPTDPVNVVLSLVYTLLVDRCHTACRLAGLDPYPANLHSLEYGRQSLPLDLVEEFRAIVGDSLTLALFNMRMLKKDDFETPAVMNEADPHVAEHKAASRPIILRNEAFKKVLAAFARKMETEFQHPHAGRKMTYSEAVNWQAKEYRRVVEGKVDNYIPLLWH